MRLIDADDAMERIKQAYEDMGVDTHGVWNKQLAEIFKTADVEDIRICLHRILGAITQAPSIEIIPRKAVKGYEGYYEVDMYGRVYSLERTITVNDNGRVYEKPVKECELSQSTHSAGYKTVGLTRDGKTETAYVHRLVAEAYIMVSVAW